MQCAQYVVLLLFSVCARAVFGGSDQLESITVSLGGRGDWDYVSQVGLFAPHPKIWSTFEQLGSALTTSLGDWAGYFEFPSDKTVNMTLLDGQWILLKEERVDHLRTSILFSLEASSEFALQGGANALKRTHFIAEAVPFAGYEHDASMMRIGVRISFFASLTGDEQEHNTNFIRHFVDNMADSLRIRYGAFPCSAHFRSFSGTCNNPYAPDWGTCGTFLRRIPKPPGTSHTAQDPSYKGGSDSDPDTDRPNPRDISNRIFAQDSSVESRRGATAELVWWGQFIDHDMDFTPGSGGTVKEEAMDFDISPADPMATGLQSTTVPFSRSRPAPRESPYSSRTQVNMQTSFVDASQVYGCQRDRSHILRKYEGGQLKAYNGMLPNNSVEALGLKLHNEATSDESQFAAGDARANEQPLLTAHHTLFVREHNRIARVLAAKVPCFADEQIFHYARKIISAQIQYITYRFFLPALLGRGAMPPYTGYDPSVDPSIDNFFSTAAFRYGHSQVPDELKILERRNQPHEDDGEPLHAVFFNPGFVLKVGIESLLLGATHQKAQAVDVKVVDSLRSHLFKSLTGGLDLIALNIQRGRDHGIPLYCDARELYGLSRPSSFRDITSDESTQRKLRDVYGSIDKVEAFVGGLAEDPLPDSELGSLFHEAVKRQFIKLRDGDRFFYEAIEFPTFLESLPEVQEIRTNTLTLQDIIVRNAVAGSPIAHGDFPQNVFLPGSKQS